MNSIFSRLQAPDDQTFIAVTYSGLTGSWYRARDLYRVIAGINKQTTIDFGLRKGTKFKIVIYLLDDGDWTIGPDGVHGQGKIYDSMIAEVSAKEPLYFVIGVDDADEGAAA